MSILADHPPTRQRTWSDLTVAEAVALLQQHASAHYAASDLTHDGQRWTIRLPHTYRRMTTSAEHLADVVVSAIVYRHTGRGRHSLRVSRESIQRLVRGVIEGGAL